MRSEFSAKAGFTLIEVLIAAVVLFTVVGTALLTFQVALSGTQKAADRLVMLSALSPIQSHVKTAITDAPKQDLTQALSGSNHLLDIRFDWQAQISEAAPPPARFDPESTRFVAFEPRFLLYEVRLQLRYKTAYEELQYTELAILPELKEKQ
jgi:prepilin-type N-terminal cleavage/methylation domain-containing protein